MARIKLGDKVVINANKYRKEMGGDIGGFPISGLLNPKIASTIEAKIAAKEVAEVIYLESLVADIKFADGFVTTIERKTLDFS